MPRDSIAPILVVEDVVVGKGGFVLLPAVPREGLHLGPGDTVDVVYEEERHEVEVLSLEPDRDPGRVRLRVSSGVPMGPGFEVWRSQSESHVMLRRPVRAEAGVAVTLSGARAGSLGRRRA